MLCIAGRRHLYSLLGRSVVGYVRRGAQHECEGVGGGEELGMYGGRVG